MYRQKNKNTAWWTLPVDVCLYNIILYRACISTKNQHYSLKIFTSNFNHLYIIPCTVPIYLIRKSRKLSSEEIVSPIYYSELSLDDRVSFFLCPVWKYRIRLIWRLGKVWRLWRGKDYYRTTITTVKHKTINSYNLV